MQSLLTASFLLYHIESGYYKSYSDKSIKTDGLF